jgi:lysyl-tRNA synthetase class II
MIKTIIEKLFGTLIITIKGEEVDLNKTWERVTFRELIKKYADIDINGKDITDKLKIYGDVDVFHRGVYNIKCIVRGESGIKSIRNMNVVVE